MLEALNLVALGAFAYDTVFHVLVRHVVAYLVISSSFIGFHVHPALRTSNMTSSDALRGLRTLSRCASPRRIPAPRGGLIAESRRGICLDCRRSLRIGNGAQRHVKSARASLPTITARAIPAHSRGYALAATECMLRMFRKPKYVLMVQSRRTIPIRHMALLPSTMRVLKAGG